MFYDFNYPPARDKIITSSQPVTPQGDTIRLLLLPLSHMKQPSALNESAHGALNSFCLVYFAYKPLIMS